MGIQLDAFVFGTYEDGLTVRQAEPVSCKQGHGLAILHVPVRRDLDLSRLVAVNKDAEIGCAYNNVAGFLVLSEGSCDHPAGQVGIEPFPHPVQDFLSIGIEYEQSSQLRSGPDAGPGIYEQGVDVSGMLRFPESLASLLVELVGVRVYEIQPELGSGHEDPAFSVLHRYFLQPIDIAFHFIVAQLEVRESIVFRIEYLQPRGRSHPEYAPAVLENRGDKVAGKRIVLARFVVEPHEIHTVKAVESVVRSDPQEAVRILEHVIDLRIGQT